jgi:hypothetical protein
METGRHTHDMRHGEMETWRNGDMEKWRHGKMDMDTDMDMETWTWTHGRGVMDMETWTWKHGHGVIDMDMETKNGKQKPTRFSLIRLPFAYSANGSLSLSVCVRRHKRKLSVLQMD